MVAVGDASVEVNLPSRYRIVPGSCDIAIGVYPETSTSIPSNLDDLATDLVNKVNSALEKKDTSALSALFIENSYWRDHLCVSWDFRTVKGREEIVKYAIASSSSVNIQIDRSSPFKAPHAGPIDAFGDVNGVEFFIHVTTSLGSGTGVVRLAQHEDQWKIFTIFTSLRELTGYEEAVGRKRPLGALHGEQHGRKNWLDQRNVDVNFEEKVPAVLIIGAGQSGLTAAARLKMLEVETLIIDQEDRIGDNWRRRYHQLVLHDPVWFDQMPYLAFPSSWPVFTPKDKLAEFFESYVKLLELNVWTKTELISSVWDETKKQWTVVMQRRKEDGTTETRTLHPHHVIQATGHSGKKEAPTFPGMKSFKGDRICHSSEFPGADSNAKGKKAVVIGSCNSGHDIAQDYVEKGYDVTMVQRSSTCVVSSASITEISMKGLYEEGGPPTEDADIYLWSIAPELFKAQQLKVSKVMRQHDANILAGLEKVGFKVDSGPMETGLMMKYFQRGGGYYIDVGGSQLIIDGKIKIKQGQEISEILPHGVLFADGSHLEADEIVFATGYQNMRTQARVIFGDEVADRVGDVWGLDREGEFRIIWRRSGHPGFWFMGGNLALCRYYSRLLALQIKAIEAGLVTY